MIRNLKLSFGISHLSYSPRTIPLLQKYQQPAEPFPLINLQNQAAAPSLLSRLLNPTPHAELLQLYLAFIQTAQEAPEGIAYQSIEQNLRSTVLRQLQQKQMKVTVDSCRVLSSDQIEEVEFRGVFIHRHLNLSASAYEIKPHSSGAATFELKKSLRSDVVQEYERAIRNYSKERLDDVYCSDYDDFQRTKTITRSIYRMVADISVTVEQGGRRERLGGRPTEHLVQVESVFNRYYNMHEHFLTDLDFLLSGNYFLANRV